MPAKLCEICGAEIKRGKFTYNKFRSLRFCSQDCVAKSLRTECPPLFCKQCTHEIPRRAKEGCSDYSARIYCSPECQQASHKGDTLSGTCETCGEPLERKFYPGSGRWECQAVFKHRRYCSAACKLASGTRGNGTSEKQYRRRARKLMGPRCQSCGTVADLDAHHIDRDISNNEPENILTLCGECHTRIHVEARKLGVTDDIGLWLLSGTPALHNSENAVQLSDNTELEQVDE